MRAMQKLTGAFTAGIMAVVMVPALVSATTTTDVVTEDNVSRQPEGTSPLKDWVIYTRTATPGAAAFVTGPSTPPAGTGSLELTTIGASDKVYAFNFSKEGTKLADIETISYSTYRNAGNLQQVAALNMVIDFNGAAEGGFSTLVYEPVYNTAQGPVVSGDWQDWVASGSGVWWSTRAINGQCAGATAACDMTWDEIKNNNPDAIIEGGFGVNQGGGNPGLVTSVDALKINDTTYNFEEKRVSATNKDQCKNGGFRNFQTEYKNQGDCVSAVASEGKAKGNPEKQATPVQAFFRSLGF